MGHASRGIFRGLAPAIAAISLLLLTTTVILSAVLVVQAGFGGIHVGEANGQLLLQKAVQRRQMGYTAWRYPLVKLKGSAAYVYALVPEEPITLVKLNLQVFGQATVNASKLLGFDPSTFILVTSLGNALTIKGRVPLVTISPSSAISGTKVVLRIVPGNCSNYVVSWDGRALALGSGTESFTLVVPKGAPGQKIPAVVSWYNDQWEPEGTYQVTLTVLASPAHEVLWLWAPSELTVGQQSEAVAEIEDEGKPVVGEQLVLLGWTANETAQTGSNGIANFPLMASTVGCYTLTAVSGPNRSNPVCVKVISVQGNVTGLPNGSAPQGVFVTVNGLPPDVAGKVVYGNATAALLDGQVIWVPASDLPARAVEVSSDETAYLASCSTSGNMVTFAYYAALYNLTVTELGPGLFKSSWRWIPAGSDCDLLPPNATGYRFLSWISRQSWGYSGPSPSATFNAMGPTQETALYWSRRSKISGKAASEATNMNGTIGRAGYAQA